MYQTLAAFEFRHLPVAGGLFDQHPDMIDKVVYIKIEQAKQDELERNRKRRNESGPVMGKGRKTSSLRS